MCVNCFTSAAYRTSPGIPTSVFQSLIVALVLSRLDYRNSVLFKLPANLVQRIQSVQNSAARLIFRIRRSEHITPALISLHWLRVPERISFKLAVMTYRSIHGTSLSYLQSCFTRVSDITSRRRLRSSISHRLEVPPVRLSIVGKRSFPISGSSVWNDLPLHVASAPSLAVFRQRLKTFLFSRYYQRHYHMTHVLLLPLITTVWTLVVLAIINIIYATLKCCCCCC